MSNLFDNLKLKLIINFANIEKKKSTTMGKIEYLRIFLNKDAVLQAGFWRVLSERSLPQILLNRFSKKWDW